jgi:cell division transport system ATP-binding protein
MIKLHRITKYYENKIPAINDINLSIRKGEFVFITGPSGAGKSTLIKLIFSSEQPNTGEIVVNNENITRMSSKEIPYFRRKVGVVFQDFKIIQNRSVFDNVAFPLDIIGTRRKLVKKKVWQVLKWVGLLQKKDSLPSQLSGGEQQRVAIARAIINNPILLLADEPTGNLDPKLSFEIMKLFKAINARGTTVVIATHDKNTALNFSENIITLERGKLAG